VTPFAALAATSAAVAATPSRREKVALLAAAMRGLRAEEIRPGVAYLCGGAGRRQPGVGWSALRDMGPAAAVATLTVTEVDAAIARLAALAGSGSQAARRRELAALMGRATPAEQGFLRDLLLGNVRQGALEGVALAAIAEAAAVPMVDVRRAAMLRGDLPAVAEAALTGGAAAVRAVSLEVGTPLRPMLARTAPTARDALDRIAPAAVEWKLDGARIQAHRDGSDVRVFTRSLDDVTAGVPEVVEAVLALHARSVVLDGEAIALREDGRPHPFQVTGSRFARRRAHTVPLTPFFFDVLHLDGTDVLDRPGAERTAVLAELAPPALVVPRRVAADGDAAEDALAEALARGHEGVIVKSLDAPYQAGARGEGWIKVKPRHTLDLVVLAAEWGHGRRRGWLSNLHLGARGPDGFIMLGKTFKGLTDAMLAWQTERLLALEVSRTEWRVDVRPELVVEIAFDGVQRSSRYPGGVALRFARVLRHRPDKSAADADTIEAVRAVHTASD
jgi:DNA ligase 1